MGRCNKSLWSHMGPFQTSLGLPFYSKKRTPPDGQAYHSFSNMIFKTFRLSALLLAPAARDEFSDPNLTLIIP